MSDSNREHLSTLMDGEMDRRGARFLVRRLVRDGGLTATWQRYHLVRNCMRKVPPVRENLSDRIARAIEHESLPRSAGSRWLKPIAGSAIAATVALMAIVAVNNNLLDSQAPAVDSRSAEVVDSTESAEGFVSESSGLDRPFTRQAMPVSYSEQRDGSAGSMDRDRISSYVLRHNQALGTSGRIGFVSYVPIVTSGQLSSPETAEVVSDEQAQAE